MEDIKNKNSVESLSEQLESAGIDTSEWGTGQAKTLAHLAKEIEDKETVLIVDEDGELLRKVTVVGADVYHLSPDGKKYHLKEEKQVFNDGRERSRDLVQAVSEKIKEDEEPREAMIRGIQEELGVTGQILPEYIKTKQRVLSSPSYPGLKSKYVVHEFRVMLNDEQFNPSGYIETQDDKSTYFIWEEIAQF